ncbi:DUF106 domain-containing protein [Candidatus Woesearchaeota archaeon]|nr:DUF106 domain-containing protein [Candidatus Woesearchaeota archaeon]
MVLEKFFNFIFGWAISFGNPWTVIIISFLLTLLVNLTIKFLSDQKLMKELKEEGEKFKKEMKEFKDDPHKLMEIQKKVMENSLNYMKQSMWPTLFTLLPLLLVFRWMGNTFKNSEIILQLPFSVPLIGKGLGWLGTYILFSLIFSLILRKVLKLH